MRKKKLFVAFKKKIINSIFFLSLDGFHDLQIKVASVSLLCHSSVVLPEVQSWRDDGPQAFRAASTHTYN